MELHSKNRSGKASTKDSYKIKAICKQCNKFISNTPTRIKAHLLKCKGENVDDDEIVSIVRVWDNSTMWQRMSKN